MDAYFDSAIIVKLYVQEASSSDVLTLVAHYNAPYVLTQWQTLEVKNAIRLKSFRGEITSMDMTASLSAFEQDISTGRWQRPTYSTAAIELKAEELSAMHSTAIGCRTLDIIHVAAALIVGAKDFVTFDERQAALAKQTGLSVKP